MAPPNNRSALDRPASNANELRQLFSRPDVLEQIKLTLPKHMSPDRLTKVFLSAVLQTPMLMRCNQLTLLQSLTKLSELGLEPGSALGHVYLIPFENQKAGRVDVNIIVGYRGYIELARRSGWVQQIETHVAFEDDTFELVYGLDDVRKLRHVPNWKTPRTPEKAFLVYCIARLKDGASHVEVMPMEEVRTIRNRSQSWKRKPNTGPWHDDFLEMARKTVLRRAAKYLPMSPEQAAAEGIDDDNGDVVQGEVVLRPTLPAVQIPAGGDDIANQMASSDEPAGDHDPVTGEVASGEPATEQQATEQQALPEPEAGTAEHLMWRVAKASAEELGALTQEAAKLPKDEPRRLEVGKAIAERRKAVQS
jgi:recombination protein RecT